MFLFLSAAWATPCTATTLAALAAMPAPAVFVLAERKGTQPDLGRASRLVARLRKTGEPLTVALQAIQPEQQPLLDRFAAGDIEAIDLPDLLNWNAGWGFPWSPYLRLITGGANGDRVVGVGISWEPQPKGAVAPRPPGYLRVLSDTMLNHYMPAELEPVFVQNVAWFDHRLAKEATQNWTGKGYLIVVADRLHIEGGKGIGWQLQRMVNAPVITVNLGGPGQCYADDLYLGP